MIILFLLSAYAQDFLQMERNLRPIQGCPMESYCDKAAGALRYKWEKTLKGLKQKTPYQVAKVLEKTRQKDGIPIPVWGRDQSLIDHKAILWDSPATAHQKEKRIFEAEIFLKKYQLSNLFAFRPLITEKSTYWIPRGEMPYRFHRNKFEFIRESDGIYYVLIISKKGKWKVGPAPENFTHSPFEPTECSSKLKMRYSKLPLWKNLYGHAICYQYKSFSFLLPKV